MDLMAAARSKWFAQICAAVLTIGFVALRIWDPLPLQALRLKTFDIYQRIHPRPTTQQPVIIVDIDEESLRAYGQWPWPRTRIADLVDRLMEAQVAVVGLDMMFPEPDRMSPENVARSVRGLDPDQRRLLAGLPDNDAVLAGSLRGARVVLGQATTDRPVVSPGRGAGVRKSNFAKMGGDPVPFVFRAPGLVRNLPVLEENAAGVGLLSLVPEIDGLVRRVPLVMAVGDALYPTLTVEMLRVAADAMVPDARINTLLVKTLRDGLGSIVVPELAEIPTDERGRAWVNFAEPGGHRYLSAKSVLDGTADKSRLEGHFVLVGTSAAGLNDIKPTPVAPSMPGVEVHAQLLETMLSNSYLRRPGYAYAAELTLLAGICLLMMATVAWLGPVGGLVGGAVTVGAALAISWYLYVAQNLLLSVTNAALAGFVLYTTLTVLSFLRNDAEKRRVRTAFSRYLSPDLVEQLVRNPGKLHLGGEMKDMTILFCDIRGFTSISELYKSDPEGLTVFINRYLTPLTDTVLSRHGTIDKYMGDCIMAFWNAPLDDEDHANHACRAALDMLAEIAKLNAALRAEADVSGRRFIPIRMGFGLNSGVCCVGNMGSEQRFDYSVIGDDVNLAARLESQSKNYSVDVVVGGGTTIRAPEYAWLELDLIKVKGKQDAEHVYALLGGPEVASEDGLKSFFDASRRMIAAYRSGDWAAARRAIADCREHPACERFALAGFFGLYEARIAAFEENPPGPGWDGVFVATEK